MKKLCSIFMVLLTGCMSLPLDAAEIVSAAFTFSGTPSDGDTVTVNSTVRTFRTTVSTASTEIEIDGQNGSAENMYQHYINYSETGLRAAYNDADITTLITFPTTTISASESSAVIAVNISTQSLTQSQVVRVPSSSVNDSGSTNRTFIADELADWLSDYNTNPIEMPDGAVGAPSFTFQSDTDSGIFWDTADTWYLVAGGTTQLIVEDGTLTFTGTLKGTNTVILDAILDDPITTNLVNYGNAIRSPGSGASSEQFGTGADSAGIASVAIGNNATTDDTYGIAIGYLADGEGASTIAIGSQTTVGPGVGALAMGISAAATNTSSIAIGASSDADGDEAVAIGATSIANSLRGVALGYEAYALHTNTVAIGYSADASFSNSVAIGASSASTADHQIRLGTASEFVSVPGDLDVDGDIYEAQIQQVEFPRFDNTSLASGNNAAVNLSTNSFVRISSGPGAAFTVNGIAGGEDGRKVTIYNATSYNMTIANDSGTDPTAANRIYTLTGSDYATTGTGAATLIYDSGASRWILISTRD